MNPDDPIKLGLGPDLPVEGTIERIQGELANTQSSRRRRVGEKFIVAALSGIPWVGGYLSAAASLRNDESSARENELQNEWLEEHKRKLHLLDHSLKLIEERFVSLGEQIDERIESEDYLGLVRAAFRTWDEADTAEKRNYVANVLTNAAGTRLCSDDVIRMFLDWISTFHESHLAVVREISSNPGSTRAGVWAGLYNIAVRDDSAEADLFKLIFRDLSTGQVIRQERDVDALGRFRVRPRNHVPKGFGNQVMKSPFDDKEQYVLTNMGKQFVHYAMNETVTRIGAGPNENSNATVSL